jgi:hypothetical protein
MRSKMVPRAALERIVVCLTVIVAMVSPTMAASAIPSSEMPGRERERFNELPVERFMRPGPYLAPPAIEPGRRQKCPIDDKRSSNRRAKRVKAC